MTRTKKDRAKDRANARKLIPLIALGGSLATAPAAALELGDARVKSNLGQPLRASIAYALAPNEMLSSTCVSVRSGQPTTGLPGIGRSTVTVTESAIVITGQSALREPMVGVQVAISCPYAANLSREYMLFVDPAPVADARIAATPSNSAIQPVAQQPAAAQAPARSATAAATPIGQASRYQVQPGDSVSSIVLRVENRTMGLFPAVNAVFAANPDAFIDNDPNKLKAGSWLSIPSLDGTAPVVVAVAEPEPVSEVPAADEVEPAATVYEPVDAIAPIVVEVTPRQTVAAPAATTTSSPVVTTTVVSTGARSESTSLLAWLVGGGLAVLGALVLFGRRLRRDDTTTAPLATPAAAAQPEPEPVYDVVEEFADYDIEDDSPTEENLALDANLESGTGFDTGVFPPAHMDVESILESEVLPEDEDYDMSVIVDATKMPQPEDATEHDLKAVEIAADDGTLISDNYTISREVDYDVLEQDYEDELSATQALNQEIERAAAELARDLEEGNDEATAELDASCDPNDTRAVTINMSHDDKTSKLPVANDDETAEMEVSGGRA